MTITEESKLVKHQVMTFGPRRIEYFGEPHTIAAKVRFDDECGNGHNSFSITADIHPVDRRRGGSAGGCLHDEVAKAFPELAKYIKWHSCSTDGPMYYVKNTIFMAGDRDCWGYRKGEPKWMKYYVQPPGGMGVLVEWPESEHRILGPKPQEFKTREDAEGVANACGGTVIEWTTAYGDGKDRELDVARRSAVWPDATNEDLIAPGLKERLEARLPALLAEFRKDVEELGLVW